MKTYFKNQLEGYPPNQVHTNGYSAKRESGIKWDGGQRILLHFLKKIQSIIKNINSCHF